MGLYEELQVELYLLDLFEAENKKDGHNKYRPIIRHHKEKIDLLVSEIQRQKEIKKAENNSANSFELK